MKNFTNTTLFIRRLSFIFLLTFSFSFASFGQGTVLAPGDIMVLQIDETEKFIFVTFVDLMAGTTIYFTDCGVFTSGGFIDTGIASSYLTCPEGAIKFVTDGAIDAGTVFQYGGNTPQTEFSAHTDALITGSLDFNYEADQVIVFQDGDGNGPLQPSANPSFIFILDAKAGNFSVFTDPSIVGMGGGSPGTSIPSGLTDLVTAIAVGSGNGGDFDNVIFDGTGIPFTGAATLAENIAAAKANILARQSVLNLSDGLYWLGEDNPSNILYLQYEAEILGAVNILPVELISFNGRPKIKSIDLQWVTASEINNDYFTVEKSTNGIDFKEMTDINGRGTTTLHSFYNWADESPNDGLNYYRLLQVDFNGDKSYSDIIAIAFKGNRDKIQLYPNPTTREVNINLPENWDEETSIVIYDFYGNVINSFTISSGSLTFPVDNIPAGFYRLSAITKSRILNTSFVKN